jgi:Na+/H+ antiporter NhaD/arsenite permease-like protein
MLTALIACFCVGYLAIAFEHQINVNKAASALLTGVLAWTLLAVWGGDLESTLHHLEAHLGEISSILFFLLGAMVVVELIDAHDGFELITQRIRTTDGLRLLWTIALLTFFLSAVLDNLTTTIVMVSLLRKLIGEAERRMLYAGLVVIAANAGGAWSVLGDVTTTMLWAKGQVTPWAVTKGLFLPSLVCLLVPVLGLRRSLRGTVVPPAYDPSEPVCTTPARERNLVLGIGVGVLLFVPVFKMLTHLPPYMGMLLGLGIIWILVEMVHAKKDTADKETRSVQFALRKIDTPSILFFLGILLAVSAMESVGVLTHVSAWLDQQLGSPSAVGVLIGLFSAVVDNVPLVAAAQGMYSLDTYPTDHFFWEFLAYCAGTGGSILIIGSAAGVAAMGMEHIPFGWYLRRIGGWAFLGYLAGAGVYLLLN